MLDREQPPGSAAGTGEHGSNPYLIRFFLEEPSGNTYRAEAMSDTLVGDLAADFFEERNWPTRDQAGRPQRAVVELVDPDDPERTTRLRHDQTLEEGHVCDDSTVRIGPESIAGLYNTDDRLRALVLDYREVRALTETDPNITIETNSDYNPTNYTITFRYKGMRAGPPLALEYAHEHRVAITLPSDYPLSAPLVQWKTPIYHPNIDPRYGVVCLGVLAERYTPGLGLAHIVQMLRDMIQYRNYGILEGILNRDAGEWAISEAGQDVIVKELDGISLATFLELSSSEEKQHERAARGPRVRFEPCNRFHQEG
jgi:ubiquitin-protein ligase